MTLHPFLFPRMPLAEPRRRPLPGRTPIGPGVNEEDRFYRNEVAGFFATRLRAAHTRFSREQLVRFLDFRDRFERFFRWDSRPELDVYVAIPAALRKRRFEEFRAQADSWELLLLYTARPRRPHGPRRDPARETAAGRRPGAQFLDTPQDVTRAAKVLGVSPAAGLHDVRRRYIELAKTHHPDRAGDVGTMQEINAAYRCVLDFLGRVRR